MELKKIKKNSTEFEIEISNEDETLLNPIIEVLLKNKNVEYAEYTADHPESKKRRLYMRVKSGKPEDILKKTVKQLEKEVSDFIKSIDDQTKSKK